MADYGKGKINFYAGADYGLDPSFKSEYAISGFSDDYRFRTGNFGFPTDPRSVNQLTAVSQKLNTGAKSIEFSAIQAQQLESIPKQHFKELNRLKQLVGVDLTFHGPLLEPSGWGEGGWSEMNRQGAKRQMQNAMERAHDLDPKGNVVVTFHSTSGLPELTQRIKGKEGEEVKQIAVFDEYKGEATFIKPKPDYLLHKGKIPDVYDELEDENKRRWGRELTQLGHHARQGQDHVESPLRGLRSEAGFTDKQTIDLYSKYKKGEAEEFFKTLEPETKKLAQGMISNVTIGEIYLRDSYVALQEQFNKAWSAVEKEKNIEDKKKLESYQKELENTMKELGGKKAFDDPRNLVQFGNVIQQGVNVLNSLSDVPKSFKPLDKFIIDKSSDTFAEIATDSFKKFGNNAPIISIENPPAGSGLSRAEDLRMLVEKSRDKFVKLAQEKMNMSEHEAKQQAEKLIGVTWDVGHINMLRKFGYGNKELEKQTEKIAPFIKHVHLSDNFGFEHTELPMGMGDVPLKEHYEAMKKFGVQLDKIKQVVETGNWFEPFKVTPIRETFRAFGSPVYSMQMAPYWNQAAGGTGGYFSGYGNILPDIHFSQLYGSGFSNLPPELGGQMGGRSRVSGAPIE